MNRRTLVACLSLMTIATNESCAQNAQYDLNAPFGWCNATSLTQGDAYTVTGGSSLPSPKTITLTSSGSDMRSQISSALANNDIIIFDGAKGDFVVGYSIDMNSLSNKTIVGINGARLCTQFFLTEEIRNALDMANVRAASTSSGTGGTLSNGTKVDEARELLTRQTIINLTKDNSETCRKAGIFNVKKCNNIIIRNIKFVGPGPCDVGGYDLISATNTEHLWVDHCEFTDGIDGNFDITKQSNFVTVSWCTFAYTDRAYDHMNTNLVGSSDNDTADEDKLNITFAYNIWGYRCNQRMPMARFGTIHMLNNLFDCAGNSNAINPRKNSEFLIEGNYFAEGVKPFGASADAKSYVFDNNYAASGTTFSSKGSTTIPYSYEVFDPQQVPDILTAANGAGATLSNPLAMGPQEPTSKEKQLHSATDAPHCTRYTLTGILTNQTKGLYIEHKSYDNGRIESRLTMRK